jgi:hypothetical protein
MWREHFLCSSKLDASGKWGYHHCQQNELFGAITFFPLSLGGTAILALPRSGAMQFLDHYDFLRDATLKHWVLIGGGLVMFVGINSLAFADEPPLTLSMPGDTGHFDDGDLVVIDGYEMQEVILPVLRDRHNVKAIRVTLHGSNLRSVAQPLLVFVGNTPLQFLRIAPDERSVTGILLTEPNTGAFVEVHMGDQDAVRYPVPVSPQAIKRL